MPIRLVAIVLLSVVLPGAAADRPTRMAKD